MLRERPTSLTIDLIVFFSTNLNWIKINGDIVNEAGWAGILAGHYNVPVAFLAGDDQAVIEAKKQFENIETVQVKQSMGRDCALSYPLKTVTKQLQSTIWQK